MTSSQLHDVDRAALLRADATTQRLARSRPNVIYLHVDFTTARQSATGDLEPIALRCTTA